MDEELFQVLTLALLFLTLVALLAALATLSGIKKFLSEGTRSAPSESAYAPPASTHTEPQSAYSSAYSGGYGAEPAATEPAPASEPAAQEVATGYVPLSEVSTPEPAGQAAAATSTPIAAEPEEQPFERDGRWWFKRGDELLVYDEGTGQWVAAGDQPVVAPASAAPTTTAAIPTTSTEAGEGWRCSSCGAINGSTATVCRMCFTPR